MIILVLRFPSSQSRALRVKCLDRPSSWGGRTSPQRPSLGDREKLATHGPTLALNFAACEALARATHLAVIGYSFGDAHINAIIRDWLAADG